MKVGNIPTPVLYVGGLAVVGIVAYFLIKKGASVTADALNPVNPDNIINTGFNAGLQATGLIDEGSSFGSTIYDWFHFEYDPNATTPGPAEPSIFDKISSWLSPAALGGAPPVPAAPPAASNPYDFSSYLSGVNTAADPLSATSFSWYP